MEQALIGNGGLRIATSEVKEKTVIKKSFIREHHLYILALIPLGAGITLIAREYLSADTVEKLFSQSIYPVLVKTLGAITSLLPFSLTELAFATTILLLLFGAVKGIVSLIKGKRPSGKGMLRVGCNIAVAVAVVYFAFVIFCGLNYYRNEFAVLNGMPIEKSSSGELATMCKELTADANRQREGLDIDESGNMKLAENAYSTAKQATAIMNEMSDKGYPLLFKSAIVPKPFVASKAMSMADITGFYFPLTAEANIDIDVPDYTIPATMCHELAHTRGFMREDEANFIAYLTCYCSTEPDFQYSGTMLALVHSMNKLYSVDIEAFREIAATYSEGVHADFIANNLYWKQFEGVPSQIGSAINNTYLKANAQADGVQSYGRMVDLLLAEYRSRRGA